MSRRQSIRPLEPLFARKDSKERGRHLVATTNVTKGELIFAERPLLSLVSLENQQNYNLNVCHNCKAFIGGPDLALRTRCKGYYNREEQLESDILSCRYKCGYLFCTEKCETDAWNGFHKYLCTGPCESESHPLVQFKTLAAETNEILLLVAEWWVAQQQQDPQDERYTDFVMEPWWDVVSAEWQNKPGGFTELVALQRSCRELCQNAADLLSRCPGFRDITALDVAKRIGACEQNALGIRQRHPLCRDIFDRDLRERRHAEIIQCLAQAGFIASHEESMEDEEEEWDYSVDEIATFLSELFMDEEGSVRDILNPDAQQRDETGDDLDYLIPPLDGTAMYSYICKMNHSCDPNVIVLYKRTDWGKPLCAYCVALKEIAEGEEMTISYIDTNLPFEERQNALRNYGFQCDCAKCLREHEGLTVANECTEMLTEDVDVFGSDEEDESPDGNKEKMDSSEEGEDALQKCLEHLDTVANVSRFGTLPVQSVATTSNFILQLANQIRKDLEGNQLLYNLLQQCAAAVQDRDYCMCRIVGSELEDTLYVKLRQEGAWPNTTYREAYHCGTLTSVIGHAQECDFLTALQLLDKGIILGLPRNDVRIKDFIARVEHYAAQVAAGPYFPGDATQIIGLADELNVSKLEEGGFVSPIVVPVTSMNDEMTFNQFQTTYVSKAKPVLLPKMAISWPAVKLWRQIRDLEKHYGHRLVPVEIGSIFNGNMREDLMFFRDFIMTYIYPSLSKSFWSLNDSINASSTIAYLAQHPLIDQIPYLSADIDECPKLCGPTGPTHIYLWIGTGGTRTPLHFDSYENLFVQILGTKYIRLYDRSETSKLYVSKDYIYGAQGNMSEINCEQEDWVRHPKAKDAKYEEVLLFPGDCLYIPAGTWHYVRSITTSISVNYWF